MSVRFNCACGTAIEVPDEFAGRRGRCPKCHAVVTVPSVNKTVKITSGDDKDAISNGKQNNQAVSEKVTAQPAGVEEGVKDASLVIRMKCECGNDIIVAKQLEGRRAKCKKCGRVLKIVADALNKNNEVSKATIENTSPSIPFSHPDTSSSSHSNQHVRAEHAEQPVLIPVGAPKPMKSPSDQVQSEPVFIPESAGGESNVTRVTSVKPDNSRLSLDKLTRRGMRILLEPGTTDLYKVRLSLALGLLGIVCLIQFVNTMGWKFPVSVFCVLLLITGLAAIIVGGLVRSLRDIILGCVSVIAVFSTPLFVKIFSIRRGSRMTYTALKALIGWAGVGYVLLSGFAVLVIVTILLAIRKKD